MGSLSLGNCHVGIGHVHVHHVHDRRLSSQSQDGKPSPAEIKRMRCAPGLWDRMQPELLESSSALTPLRAGWRAVQREQLRGWTKSGLAKISIGQNLYDGRLNFNERVFLEESSDVLHSFNRALLDGKAGPGAYGVCTEKLGDELAAHRLPLDSLAGTAAAARVVRELRPPEIVQARTLQLGRTLNMGFAQVTVRFTSLVSTDPDTDSDAADAAEDEGDDAASAEGSEKKNSEGTGARPKFRVAPLLSGSNHGKEKTTRKKRHRVKNPKGQIVPANNRPSQMRQGQKAPHAWRIAFDSSKGLYFYDSISRETQWERPKNFFLSPVFVDASSGTLGTQGRVLDEQHEQDQNLVAVEQIVVLERPLFAKSTPWRVAFF